MMGPMLTEVTPPIPFGPFSTAKDYFAHSERVRWREF